MIIIMVQQVDKEEYSFKGVSRLDFGVKILFNTDQQRSFDYRR